MGNLFTIVTLVGLLVGIVAGVLAIRRYYDPESKPEIAAPSHHSVNAGRILAISVNVRHPRRRANYWIAVQPSDHRSEGQWYPQNSPLTFSSAGSASLRGVRLGRDGTDGAKDIDKSFTIGLFEVFKDAQPIFSEFASNEHSMPLPTACRLLHTIEVTRIRR